MSTTNPVVLESRADALELMLRLMRSNAPMQSLIVGASIVNRAGFSMQEVYTEARLLTGKRVPGFEALMVYSRL